MIEQPVTVPAAGTVEVDVICLNHSKNHAVLWECKSGRTVDEKQARVYAALTPEHVQRTGNVTFPDPASASIEVAYCCLEDGSEAIVRSLGECGAEMPIISLGERVQLISRVFSDTALTKQFMAGVSLPPVEEVPRFLIANTQTSKSELARDVFATIVSLLRKQVGRFSVGRVLEETFNDWACMGTDLRRYLLDMVKEILLDLCKNELKAYAQIVKATHSPKEFFVEIMADVLGRDATARTRTFQKLEALAYGYFSRLEQNRPYEPSQQAEIRWLPGFEPGS